MKNWPRRTENNSSETTFPEFSLHKWQIWKNLGAKWIGEGMQWTNITSLAEYDSFLCKWSLFYRLSLWLQCQRFLTRKIVVGLEKLMEISADERDRWCFYSLRKWKRWGNSIESSMTMHVNAISIRAIYSRKIFLEKSDKRAVTSEPLQYFCGRQRLLKWALVYCTCS